MDETLEPLLVEVRASTQGFAQDISQMRGTIDSNLVDGFARAGNALERGLVGAIRRGSLGFDDLKRIALNTINEIAAQAAQNLFAGIGGGGGLGELVNIGGIVSSLLGLPGRATGGPVSPGRGYVVGERGPELFVPTSAGRVEAGAAMQGGTVMGAPQVPTPLFAPLAPSTLPAPVQAAPPIQPPRDVRVAIAIAAPRGSSVPQSLQRSSRQVASAVRRAIAFG